MSFLDTITEQEPQPPVEQATLVPERHTTIMLILNNFDQLLNRPTTIQIIATPRTIGPKTKTANTNS